MAKNAATEQELAALHGALARQMAHMLTSGEPFPPAALSAIRQFLKDNGIDCIGRSNPGLNDIAKDLPVFEPEGGDEVIWPFQPIRTRTAAASWNQ